MKNMATKEVLVELLGKKRPVKFDVSAGDELLNLKKATVQKFADKGLTATSILMFEIKSERWQGQWIDVLEGDEIPDGSYLKVSVRNEVSSLILKYPVCNGFTELMCLALFTFTM